MGKLQLGVSVLLMVLLLVACAPAAVPAPVPQTAPAPGQAAPARSTQVVPATAAPAKAGWEVKWDETVAAAKQEGAVVLYTSLGAEVRQIVMKPFVSRYGVRIESVGGLSSAVYAKIFGEQRAGIYSVDTWIGGSTSFVPLKGALDSLDSVPILPELTDPEVIKKTWYLGQVPWADKGHTLLIGLMDLKLPLCINTNLVKPGDITAYRDLLNPKWKGQMSLNDPRVAGMGNWWFTAALEMGDVDINFMRELAAKQDIFVTRDKRLQVDWLVRGKQAIAIAPDTGAVSEFTRLGVPVAWLNLGTPAVAGSTSGISMIRRAPHPNAVRLFINWLLSQEGSTFLSQAVGAQAQRLDVPTDHIELAKVLKPGIKVYNADNEEFATKKDTYYITLSKEIYGP